MDADTTSTTATDVAFNGTEYATNSERGQNGLAISSHEAKSMDVKETTTL